MTNDEMNAAADRVADRVRAAMASGESPDDVRNLVFVNVKAEIAAATQTEERG